MNYNLPIIATSPALNTKKKASGSARLVGSASAGIF